MSYANLTMRTLENQKLNMHIQLRPFIRVIYCCKKEIWYQSCIRENRHSSLNIFN